MRVGLKLVQAIAPPRIGTTNPARRLPGRITAPITRQSPADSTPYAAWTVTWTASERGTGNLPHTEGDQTGRAGRPTYTHITIDEYEYK